MKSSPTWDVLLSDIKIPFNENNVSFRFKVSVSFSCIFCCIIDGDTKEEEEEVEGNRQFIHNNL